MQLRLRITQHSRDKALLLSIIKVIGCGTLNSYTNNQNAVRVSVSNFKDIGNKVIPLIENGVLLGGKQKDYANWKMAYDLMSKGKHLSKQGINEIMEIKAKIFQVDITKIKMPHISISLFENVII